MGRPLPTPRPLTGLNFDNRFTALLPADPDPANRRRQVYDACFSRVHPVTAPAPQLVAFSPEAAALLDLDPRECRSALFTQVFAGNRLLPGMDPHAACYGGHQFGRWAGQLGDGRAIVLGEVVNDRQERWALQLKGAGPTPYSRNADGLAVLRSSLREFLCSEAMFHLGVPTTRALSLILTGNSVERDMFYDGHPMEEPGAVVCRLAPSFLRFGNFELFAARGEVERLRQLADFTIATYFPHLSKPSGAAYSRFFEAVCQSTAQLMIHWMRVGFVHGVMNTDNMSIHGLTIDYGPYGWLEGYDPTWTPNTTDAQGRRYCFGRQPGIAHWNLAQLANALLPLVESPEPLEQALRAYAQNFETGWLTMMADKLGLRDFDPVQDLELIEDLTRLLPQAEIDMPLFFRHLAEVPSDADCSDAKRLTVLQPMWYRQEDAARAPQGPWPSWLHRYAQRLRRDHDPDSHRRQRMHRVNPKYVLRNYLAQLAIDQVVAGDFSLVEELLAVLRHPYEEQPEQQKFAEKRPEWARNRPGCSMLSCSS